MTYLAKPRVHHPGLPKNALGLTRRDYEGKISTLCAGCGHDSISAALLEACFELDLPPHRIAKLSGIGCSAKTPTYFLNAAHGFNAVHGRMPSLATGANLANRDLIYIGISGDGDTASIGIGQFVHAIRRGVNMLYMVENNGTYGLTKGQFSATADLGSKSKGGEANPYPPIDLARLALELGAGFVARSFSGDKDQLVPVIRAALEYPGFAFIDCLSPCVTFNNHEGSTKSYSYIREHEFQIADLVPPKEEITVSYAPGERTVVELHDGSHLALHKLDQNYDPGDREVALDIIESHRRRGEIATGLLYYDKVGEDMHARMKTVETPLNAIAFEKLCPGAEALAEINSELR
jgi:2-oxoglutarate/2-oxoacid ferredoxin oxidoreductase subunit beta